MARRKFTREFKLEAVKLIQERGMMVAQASRDLGVHGTVLRRWVQECAADSQEAIPGQGQMKPEQGELVRLSREVIKLKAERDILKKPRSAFKMLVQQLVKGMDEAVTQPLRPVTPSRVSCFRQNADDGMPPLQRPGRRFFHLAIPPVAARSPFRYKSTECGWCSLREAVEGVRRPMATILLIDDEAEVRMLFQIVLEGAGYPVLTAESGPRNLRLL